MKTILLLGLFSTALFFTACNFNQSINKDLTTGAYSRGKGISCNDIKIKVNEKTQKRNTFVDGEKVNFVFENVSGLKKINGKVYPGMSMVIVSNKMDTVVNEKDMFADLVSGTDLSPLQLQAHFRVNFPFENKERYKVYIKIWDKKDKGTFEYEIPFTIERNSLLNIVQNDLDYSEIYLWDETKKEVIVDGEMNIDHAFIFIMEGLDGLEVIDERVYPAFSIEIVDKNGYQILSNAEILEQYRKDGIEHKGFVTRQLPVTITFKPGEIANPCTLKASFTDLKSDRRLDVSGKLNIR